MHLHEIVSPTLSDFGMCSKKGSSLCQVGVFLSVTLLAFLEHGHVIDNTCTEEDETLTCKFKCDETDNLHLLKNIVVVSS